MCIKNLASHILCFFLALWSKIILPGCVTTEDRPDLGQTSVFWGLLKTEYTVPVDWSRYRAVPFGCIPSSDMQRTVPLSSFGRYGSCGMFVENEWPRTSWNCLSVSSNAIFFAFTLLTLYHANPHKHLEPKHLTGKLISSAPVFYDMAQKSTEQTKNKSKVL